MRFAAFALGLAACTSSPNTSPATAELDAQTTWLELALPAFRAAGCVTCHAGATAGSIGFLAGSTDLEIRDTILASGLVDFDEASTNSRTLTKGLHEGPTFTAAQQHAILTWIQSE